jgi:preprotein translocase subunit SecY
VLGPVRSAFKTPDLRKKILFTIGIIVVYRIGSTLPAPGVSEANLVAAKSQTQNSGVHQLINLFSGGSLLNLSVFALGILPYITASIIAQLLTVVIPKFEQLKKEGQSGENQLTQYTRYMTVGLSLLQGTGVVAYAVRGGLFKGAKKPVIPDPSIFHLAVIVLVMTAGATVIMWFGELITERGVGNGMSLLIFINIAARLVPLGENIRRSSGGIAFGLVILIGLAIIVAIIYIEQGQRRIPVQYAKRVVGRRMYGGTSTYLPIKVNQGGVIPVIFATSLLYIPQLISQLGTGDSAWRQFVQNYLVDQTSGVYVAVYFLLVIGFTYFYISITFDVNERADEMKKFGGFIPGIRPGRPTSEYLHFVLNRITLPGSLYLGVVAVLPTFFLGLSGSGNGQSFPFGGTSLLILVIVGLDTVMQVESQVMQRNYEGFLR